MRDGTAKLLAASKQTSQTLEAAKNLLTSNARIIAYRRTSERKTDEVMQRPRYYSSLETDACSLCFCICFISGTLCKQAFKVTLIENKVYKQTNNCLVVSTHL